MQKKKEKKFKNLIKMHPPMYKAKAKVEQGQLSAEEPNMFILDAGC